MSAEQQKNVTIPTQELDAALNHGIWFDGSSIEGFARIAESDLCLIPDASTIAVLPWLSGGEVTARLICDDYFSRFIFPSLDYLEISSEEFTFVKR